MTQIRHASYSKLLDFEACPLRAKLKHIDRIPEERSSAADRGTAIHDMAENYVKGKLKDFPGELIKFKSEFDALRREYKLGNVSLEGEWGFTQNWEPTDFKTAWLRMKLDFRMHRRDQELAIVGDHKTGKRFGNEVKHGEQVHLYAVAECIREPWVKKVIVELWYLDLDDIVPVEYTREQAMRFLPAFEKRLLKMTSATKFDARPNVFNCKWCAFGPNKGKQCPHGVTENISIADYRKKFG